MIRKIMLGVLNRTARFWPDRLFLQLKYRLIMGKKLNLDNPQTFNEKLNWLKLYNRRPEYTQMVDKYAVKKYVASKIGEEYIIPTLGLWNSPEEINWDVLPNRFVLKTTHGGGGGGVVICKDKTLFDRKDACSKLQSSLNSDIYINYREWPYKGVVKRIVAEQYMNDEYDELFDGNNSSLGEQLKDYKFFCFNGKVKCFKVDFNRFIMHRANYYNIDGQILELGEVSCPPDYSQIFEKPKNFSKMIALAEKLSASIPFARVDLYNVRGKIYFGEITFFPAAGMGKFNPIEWDRILGEWICLPSVSNASN